MNDLTFESTVKYKTLFFKKKKERKLPNMTYFSVFLIKNKCRLDITCDWWWYI